MLSPMGEDERAQAYQTSDVLQILGSPAQLDTCPHPFSAHWCHTNTEEQTWLNIATVWPLFFLTILEKASTSTPQITNPQPTPFQL